MMEEIDFQGDPFFADVSVFLPKRYPNCLIGKRDQGCTLCCYAFVLINCIFADSSIHGEEGIQGSEQELLDCLHIDYPPKVIDKTTSIPKRGLPNSYKNAFQYVKDKGLSPHDKYPWKGFYQGCLRKRTSLNSKILINDFEKIMSTDEVLGWLEDNYFVAGAIVITQRLTKWKGTAVFTHIDQDRKEIKDTIDAGERLKRHAITLIGYGKQKDVDYYLALNSYGPNWGHKGFFKVARELVTKFFHVQGSFLKQETQRITKKRKN